MRYLDEFRNPEHARTLARAITQITTRSWRIMEICGGQTHTILRFGIDQLLPPQIELIHGPGCPVCVTPIEMMDRAIEIAQMSGVIFCSFGDMLRVPGTHQDLLSTKAMGADIRTVYSPLDAVRLAQEYPRQEVVFFAVGFETTAPANALAVYQAHQKRLSNFSILVSHVLVPPAMEAILSSPQNQVQGFLAAGHVCTIMGYEPYEPLSMKFQVPIVVTGFEPLDLLQGIYRCILQLEQGTSFTENQYTRSVKRRGNPVALELIQEIFEVRDTRWRGIGQIPASGLRLRNPYQLYDAHEKFPFLPPKFQNSQNAQNVSSLENIQRNRSARNGKSDTSPSPHCFSGFILQGLKKPPECPEFGKTCTPNTPLGATMVSSEGACAAYYRYRRNRTELEP